MSFIVIAGKLTIVLGLAVVAVVDLRTRLIPLDMIVLIGVAALVVNLAVMPQATGYSLIVCAALFAILTMLSRVGIIGGGDAKLIATVSLAVSATEALALLLAIAVAGGFLAVSYLAGPRLAAIPRVKAWYSRSISQESQKTLALLIGLDAEGSTRQPSTPYAIAVFLGTLWHFLR